MIKVIIIDDEPLAISVVKRYLQAHPQMQVVQECNNGFEGVKAIMQHQPDLIFLDIQMPKINGFEMLELLDEPPGVIFTTAFDEYALKAFEANAIDYLLKPFSKERFDAAITKWLQHKGNDVTKTKQLLETTENTTDEGHRIVVKAGSEIHILPIQEVHYIEAYDDYVKINTATDCFLKKKTMSYYEKTLNAMDFVRVHRSYIIQLKQITSIEPQGKEGHMALLKSGIKIPLSKSGYARLKEVLNY